MKARKTVISVLAVVLYALMYYIMLPPLSFAYFSGFVFIALGVILIAALVGWWITPEYDNYKFGLPLVAAIIFIAIFIIGGIGGSAIFTSSTR